MNYKKVQNENKSKILNGNTCLHRLQIGNRGKLSKSFLINREYASA